MGCEQFSGCSNAESLSLSAQLGFAPSLPAGATASAWFPNSGKGREGSRDQIGTLAHGEGACLVLALVRLWVLGLGLAPRAGGIFLPQKGVTGGPWAIFFPHPALTFLLCC